jgi:di/tricarboxylate transporter
MMLIPHQWHTLFTAAVMLLNVGMIASGRFSMDWVALGTLVALYLGGVLTSTEALTGFSASATITLAGIYVVSGGLNRSGAIALVGRWMLEVGGRSPRRLSGLLFVVTSLFSAFMANLAALVIMLPLGYRMSRASRMPLGKLLMPVGTFTALGGYLTLLGTPPSLIVADLFHQQTGVTLGLFSSAVVGLPTLVLSLAWMLTIGQKLLPDTGERPVQVGPNLHELSKTYHIADQFYRLRIRAASNWVGQRLCDLGLRQRWGVSVVGVAHPGQAPFRPWPDLTLDENDELVVQGNRADVLQLASIHHLEPKGSITLIDLARLTPDEMELAEVLIPPYSSLVGHTLADLTFRRRYQLNVLAILHDGKATAQQLSSTTLQAGDRLLVEGAPRQLHHLRKEADLIILSQLGPRPEDIVSQHARLMLGILVGVIVLSILPWISLPMAAVMGALATIISGAVRPQEAYDDIDWKIIIFIAALLPLGTAINNSGLAAVMGQGFLWLLAGIGPYALLAALFTISVLLTQALSNSVLALVLTPIAIFIAQNNGLRPEPFVMAVMAGVSASFLTPISDIIALLLRVPGRYSFWDYLKVNLPPVLFMGLSVVLLTPLIWPLR